MAYTKDFKVAIVGGGIVGLICAVVLTRAGIRVDVFESASKFGEVGAGVGLGPNALRTLKALGLLEAILAKAGQEAPKMKPFEFISCAPGHEFVYDYPGLPEDLGLGIHRPALLDALIPFVDPDTTHFNKRCTHVTLPSDSGAARTTIHFSDGTTFETNLVIGTDGIRSITRNAVLGINGPAPPAQRVVFTNTVAYRGLLPIEALVRAGVKTDFTATICWTGLDKHIITFPVQNEKMVNVVVFCTDKSVPMGTVQLPLGHWVTASSKRDMLENYKDCGSDVLTLLSLVDSPGRWAVHTTYPPLDTYIKDHLALVGDAAHAMSPHLGAGVGQGIEDSLVICRLLAHPQTKLSNLRDVLQAYDQVRRPRANMVLHRSMQAGEIYESGLSIKETCDALVDLWEPVWHHDLDEDLSYAVQILEERGSFGVDVL